MAKLQSNQIEQIKKLARAFKVSAGIEIPEAKFELVVHRLTRRLGQLKINSIEDYVEYFLANTAKENEYLIALLTTHTTQFFRHPDQFTYLVERQLPKILASGAKKINIWSAACSTGEEVYSIAIAIEEFFRENPAYKFTPYTVFGTDVDRHCISEAQKGIYRKEDLGRIRPDFLGRYFDQGTGELEGMYRIKESIWSRCEFGTFNLMAAQYPQESWNAIFARNVLIYFNPKEIGWIINKFYEAMPADACLYLGAGENFENSSFKFRLSQSGIYQKNTAEGQARSAQQTSEHLAGRGPVRVMIVDDSPLMRRLIASALTLESGFEVVGEAGSGLEAAEVLKQCNPEIVTLDIQMPRMDGITYLSKHFNKNHPPVVIVSSVNQDFAMDLFKCFELGASEYIEKTSGENQSVDGEKIRETLKRIARKGVLFRPTDVNTKNIEYIYKSNPLYRDLILIGASTGGVPAILKILPAFPQNSPPIVIAIHMPAGYSADFAKHLNQICNVSVLEAADGLELQPSHVYIAPGGHQCSIRVFDKRLTLEISEGGGHLYKPSVDGLFSSAADALIGSSLRVSAALMTGMGQDGAQGLLKLRKSRARTLAQDEATSAVFGMPKAALDLGAAYKSVALGEIPIELLSHFREQKKVA